MKFWMSSSKNYQPGSDHSNNIPYHLQTTGTCISELCKQTSCFAFPRWIQLLTITLQQVLLKTYGCPSFNQTPWAVSEPCIPPFSCCRLLTNKVRCHKLGSKMYLSLWLVWYFDISNTVSSDNWQLFNPASSNDSSLEDARHKRQADK